MSKTQNGRPQHRGAIYWENKEGEYHIRKFCMGYCECGRKFGLTADELNEVASNMPSAMPSFISRLLRARIVIPKQGSGGVDNLALT